ncbi:MAG: YbjN domain-containing protein [Deltaproteobacteria bacterium]|nr:YbjN domain-containing protein [Deltaproteobacteria bacterium]
MRTMDDVERYLGLSGHPFEKVGDGTWVTRIHPADAALVVQWEAPVVVFRLKVMPVPAAGRDAFFAHLLELNATGLAHGAFGLENGSVVLVDALEAENLDANEFTATIDSFELALDQHMATLAKFAR